MPQTGVVLPFVSRPFTPTIAPLVRKDVGAPSLGILVIDATPDNRSAIRGTLESRGFVLNEAATGEAGLRLAQALTPDCILLANRLPDAEGRDILERLRGADGRLPCAVLLLSDSEGGDATDPSPDGALDRLTPRQLAGDVLRWAVRGAIERFWLIEERRRADERHGLLAALIASSADAIVSVGFDFLIQTWNPGAVRMFGHEEHEAVGRDIRELIIPPDRRAGMTDLHRAIREGQQTLLTETIRLHRDGHPVEVEASGAPLLDAAGHPAGVSVVFRGIGARKENERRLRESEAFNRELVASSPDCLKVIDAEGRLEYMNARGCELLEIDDFDALAGTPWDALWPDETRARVASAVAAAREGGHSRFEAFCPTAKGRPKWWDVAVRPVIDSQGRLLRILASSRDITAQRTAAEALRAETARQGLLLRLTRSLLGADLDESALGRLVFETIRETFHADACLNYRFDHDRNRLSLVFQRGVPPESLAAAASLDLGRSFCGAVVEDRTAIVAGAERIATDPRGLFARDMGMRAYACCPIMALDGRILGTFSLGSTGRDGFSPEEATFLGTVTNVLSQAWERLGRERALRESERRLRLTREAGGFGLWEWRATADGTLRLRGNWDRLGLGEDDIALEAWLERVAPEDRDRVRASLASLPRRGWRHDEEYRVVRADGTVQWLHWIGEPNEGEAPDTGRGIVVDTTDRKRAEQRQTLLMRELAHRELNLLAVIQSVARRTLAAAPTVEAAGEALNGRLQALARTYGTITNGAFEGAPLEEILRNELDSFGGRASLEGPRIMLHAKASQTFALIAHELATNAAKYGALSVPEGHLLVAWRVEGPSGAQRLRFEWREEDGPAPVAPTRRGFGTALVSRVAGIEFGCSPELDYGPKGFCYRFETELDQIGVAMLDSPVRRSLESDHAAALYEAWERQRGPDDRMPRFDRFDRDRFGDQSHLTIVEVDGGALRFVQVGRALTERFGRALTDEDLANEDTGTLAASYRRCADKAEPCHEHLRFDFGDGEPTTFERLLVPYSLDGRSVTHVVGISVFSSRTNAPEHGGTLVVR